MVVSQPDRQRRQALAKGRAKGRAKGIAKALAIVLTGALLPVLSAGAASSGAAGSWKDGPPSFAQLVEHVRPAVVNISTKGKTHAAAGMQGQGPGFPGSPPLDESIPPFFRGHPGFPGGGNSEREFRAQGSGFIISAEGLVVTNNHVIENADEIEVITHAGDSGFIISAEGLVVTNNHVIENADEIEVITHAGDRYPAIVKGRDPKTDLALLEVKTDTPLPFVELTSSDEAMVGDWVIAVGNPFGLGGSVTAGIISARGRDIHSGPFDDFLQIDAPINRGNSGGPLFDTQGRVIGINTAIYSPSGGSVGIGFAIPSSMAMDIIAQLDSEGSVARGWLGVQIQPVTEEVAESLGLEAEHGALVAAVMPDSPAQRAGVQAGDVILHMDGEALQEFKDLPRRIAAAKAGTEVTFEVRRQGKTRRLEVEIGRLPSEEAELARAGGGAAPDTARLGVHLAALTPEARQRYGIPEESSGVLVAGVERGSPASQAGIRPGSLISMVGQEPVRSPDDVVAEVKEAAKQERSSVLLLVELRGEKRFVAVKLTQA